MTSEFMQRSLKAQQKRNKGYSSKQAVQIVKTLLHQGLCDDEANSYDKGDNYLNKGAYMRLWKEVRRSRAPRLCGARFRVTDRLRVAEAGDKLLVNQFLLLKRLGTGSQSQVYLALNIKDLGLKAIKLSSKQQVVQNAQWQSMRRRRSFEGKRPSQGAGSNDETAGPALLSDYGFSSRDDQVGLEVAIWKKLDHLNVVRLAEVIDDPRRDKLVMVMEYVSGGTLDDLYLTGGCIEESQLRLYCRQILQGLDYLHNNRVVHGDLKPQNILLDSSGVIKLADFGSAACVAQPGGESGGKCAATPAFRAPETLSGSFRPAYKVDVWALGVCLYQWTVGQLPFRGSTVLQMYDSIRHGHVAFPPDSRVSPELRGFISALLTKDPVHRPNVAAAMQHAWVTAYGSELLTTLGVGGAPPCVSGQEVSRAIVQRDAVELSQLDSIAPALRSRTFPPGGILAMRGQPREDMYLVLSGTVEVCDGGGAFVRRTNSADLTHVCHDDLAHPPPPTRESSSQLSYGRQQPDTEMTPPSVVCSKSSEAEEQLMYCLDTSPRIGKPADSPPQAAAGFQPLHKMATLPPGFCAWESEAEEGDPFDQEHRVGLIHAGQSLGLSHHGDELHQPPTSELVDPGLVWNCTLRARTHVSVLALSRRELEGLVGEEREVVAQLRQLGLQEQRSWLVQDKLRCLRGVPSGLGDDMADLLL